MFTWVNAYSVGIEEIDIQHKKLLDFLNEVVKSQKTLQDSNIRLNKILIELKNFASFHFSTELRFMEKYHYPYLLNHQKEHDSFKESIHTIENDLQNLQENVPMEILLLLKKWVVKHLTHTDQKFYSFLKEKSPEDLKMLGI